MKIAVVGRGWTGLKVFNEMSNRGHQVSLLPHNSTLQNDLDWVINCAGVTGYPNVDACEKNKRTTIEGNAVYPILLQKACVENRIRFAHFSSGCIYSGAIDSVDAEPNFFGSVYSVSKGVSDCYLKDKALIFRIRMPFTGIVEPKNYLTKVYNYAKTGKLIEFGQNSLTDLDEAVKVACQLVIENAPNGPYNLVNSGSVDMHELADMMGIKPEWYTPEEFKLATAAGRSTCTIPANSRMRPVRETLVEAIDKMRLT